MIKGYLASGFFNKAMYDFTDKLADIIIENGVDLYVPQRNDEINDKENVNPTDIEIWKADINYLKESDVLFAVIDDEDAGVCCEIGYFASLLENTSKRGLIVGIYTDCRRHGVGDGHYYINLFATGGIRKNGKIIEFDTWEQAKFIINNVLKELKNAQI